MSQEKSFWKSAPGTVAAVAAMVTALAGAVPVIMAIRGNDGDKPAGSASPTPTETATPTGGLSPSVAPGEEGPDTVGPGGAAAPPLIASPLSVDFGRVAPGLATATQAVQLVNTGEDPVTLGQIRIIGPGAASFTISEATCREGEELAPDASCDLTMRFAPSGSGSHQATLVVDRTPGDPVQVPLSGTASLL